MMQYCEFIFTILGVLASGAFLFGVLHPHDPSNLEESNLKVRDVKNVFKITFIVLVVISIAQFKVILDNKELMNKQKEEIEKLNKQKSFLSEKSKTLEEVNSTLQKKSDEFMLNFMITESDLRSSVYKQHRISSNIRTNVFSCVTSMYQLFKIIDRSLIEINRVKAVFNESESDTLGFSKEQSKFYRKTIDILETNTNNTKSILMRMSRNLHSILKSAEELNVDNSHGMLDTLEARYEIYSSESPFGLRSLK